MTKPSSLHCSKTVISKCETDEWGNTVFDDNTFNPGDEVEYVHIISNNTKRTVRGVITDQLPLNAASGIISQVELINGATGGPVNGDPLPLDEVPVELPPGGSIRFKSTITLKGLDDFKCLPVPVTNCMEFEVVERSLPEGGWEDEGNCPEVCEAVAATVYIGTEDRRRRTVCFATNTAGYRENNAILAAETFMGGTPCERALMQDWLDSGGTLATLIQKIVVLGGTVDGHTEVTDAFGNSLGFLDTTPEVA